MKQNHLLGTVAIATALLVQGCASGGGSLETMRDNQAGIFGKVAIIDEKGNNMSTSCNVRSSVPDETGFTSQSVEVGTADLGTIFCSYNRHQYSINAESLKVHAKQAGNAYYFGDLTISLAPTNTSSVNVQDKYSATKALVPGNIATKKSLIKAPKNGPSWRKFFAGGLR